MPLHGGGTARRPRRFSRPPHRQLSSAEVVEFLGRPGARRHGLLFFADHEERRRIQYSFLKHGLEEGGACVYATEAEEADRVADTMRDYDLHPEHHAGRLRIVPGKELYGSAAAPEYERWRHHVREAFGASRTAPPGPVASRLTSDLGFSLFERGFIDQLRGLERALAEHPREDHATLCVYDQQAAAGLHGRWILAMHDFAILPDGPSGHQILYPAGPATGVEFERATP